MIEKDRFWAYIWEIKLNKEYTRNARSQISRNLRVSKTGTVRGTKLDLTG